MSKKARRHSRGRTPMVPTLRRLFEYLWRYRLLAITVLALGIVAAALLKSIVLGIKPLDDILLFEQGKKASGVKSVAPSVLENLFVGVKSWFYGIFHAHPAAGEEERAWLLRLLVILITCIAVLTAIAQFFFVTLARKLGLLMIVDLRNEIAHRLLHLSLRFHGKRRLGDLISRISNDVQVALRSLTVLLQNAIQEPVFILMNLAFAAMACPRLFLVVILVIPVLGGPFLILGKRVRRGSRKSLSVLGESTSALTEMLTGIRVVKAFRMEEREYDEFRGRNRSFLRRTMHMVRARALSQSLLIVLAFGGMALLMYFIGSYQISDDPSERFFYDYGDFFIFVTAISTTYAHIKRLARAYNTIQESLGATARLFEILDLHSELIERPGARAIERIERGLRFEKVHFAYEDEEVLRGVDIEIPLGQRVALVGPSGAGKSTIIDLVARFYDPTAGRVAVDGIDLRELALDSWLARLAIVTQEPFLFHASIEENIRYGRPDASREDVLEAARAAAIHEFIESLPEGYGTLVGERGARLSGGQLQRITIARAILRDADLLLLDEATSSLDTESESAVQKALENLMVGRTSLIIAHRLSTVRDVDRILVLDDGAVVEAGTHDELLSGDGLYRRLHDMQFRSS